jgi:hypothetical protein
MVDPVRPLVVIAGMEALAALAALVGVVVAVLTGAARGLSGGGAGLALAEVAMWVLISAALVLVWLGLYRRRRAGRTPFLLVQAFVLVTVPLIVGSDLVAYRVLGWALTAVAAAGLVLGLRPAAMRSLS